MKMKIEKEEESRLPKVLIPMIRRTFPEIVSSEIVHVSAFQYSQSFLEHLAKVTESGKVAT